VESSAAKTLTPRRVGFRRRRGSPWPAGPSSRWPPSSASPSTACRWSLAASSAPRPPRPAPILSLFLNDPVRLAAPRPCPRARSLAHRHRADRQLTAASAARSARSAHRHQLGRGRARPSELRGEPDPAARIRAASRCVGVIRRVPTRLVRSLRLCASSPDHWRPDHGLARPRVHLAPSARGRGLAVTTFARGERCAMAGMGRGGGASAQSPPSRRVVLSTSARSRTLPGPPHEMTITLFVFGVCGCARAVPVCVPRCFSDYFIVVISCLQGTFCTRHDFSSLK